MFKIEVVINLIIVSIDLKNGIVYILSTKKDICTLPEISLTNKIIDIGQLSSELCEKYVDLDTNWINVTQNGVYIHGDKLHIFFMGLIPKDTQLLHGATFITFDNINLNEYIKFLILSYFRAMNN